MKAAIIAAVAGAASLANAKPHGHGHAHRHQKREPDAVTVLEPVSTALAFVLNGETISQDDVCKGIASGDLKWEGTVPSGACAAISSITVSTSTAAASSSSETPTTTPTSKASAQVLAESSATSASSTAAASSSAAATSASSSQSSSSGSSLTGSLSELLADMTTFVELAITPEFEDFPDGEVKCSDGPPTAYGAMRVNYLGMNGWASLQQLNSALNEVESDATDCTDNVSCAYVCPVGYQPIQWIEDQPSNGVSVGGLLCKNGYLYKANSNSKLCNGGVGGVSLQNEVGSDLAACRTMYPANEAENSPVDIAPGSTQPLACPDENTYYQHLGAATSAQYYLNNPGVTASQGCSWNGQGDKKSGNWAPINLGVGATSGTKWLSIFQNSPTSTAVYQGNVNITGSGVSSPCYYQVDADGMDGSYCGASSCCKVSSGNNCGCTASVTGDAVFVVS